MDGDGLFLGAVWSALDKTRALPHFKRGQAF
jgi:hypothetical protein